MQRLVLWVGLIGFSAAALPAFAQVRCTMPNGVVMEQRFAATCPAGAVKAETMQGAAAEIRSAPVPTPLPTPLPPSVSPAMAAVPSVVAPVKPAGSGGFESEGLSVSMWLVVIGGTVALILAIKGSLGVSGKPLYCASCGYEGPGKMKTRGSILIEFILWLCFLVPGLIYSIWRQGSKYKACKECGATTLVPVTSPIALASKRALSPDAPL